MGAAGAGDSNPVGEDIARVETLAVLAQPLVWAGMGRRFPWALIGLEAEARIGWGIVAVLVARLRGAGRALAPRDGGAARRRFGGMP